MIEDTFIYLNFAIASANIIFIVFYYLQLRESRKAIIITKFLSERKEGDSKEEILEILPQYLYVENISKNKIKKLRVNGTFLFDNKRLTIEKKLDYLNPHERGKILIRLGDLIDKFPDLFKEYEYKNKKGKTLSYLKIPKKTLKVKFKITFRWGLINKQNDEYELEWLSKDNCPDLKYHPRITSINKRNGIAMEKVR